MPNILKAVLSNSDVFWKCWEVRLAAQVSKEWTFLLFFLKEYYLKKWWIHAKKGPKPCKHVYSSKTMDICFVFKICHEFHTQKNPTLVLDLNKDCTVRKQYSSYRELDTIFNKHYCTEVSIDTGLLQQLRNKMCLHSELISLFYYNCSILVYIQISPSERNILPI